MCGINGFSFNNQSLIEKMNQRLRHRGPDQEGFFVGENISLGQTRLSIIDLSEKGKPPIFNEDESMVIIANGEIYNFQKIRKDLIKKGHSFYSRTDTEVTLHAYEEYGPSCLELLNGIFAFAIWDKKKNELFLARDRLGVKPLYYYWQNNQLIFSSEIKAILEHKIERKVDKDAFNHYFRLGFVPTPLTMFEGIKKLPAAHYLVFKNNQIEIRKYWQIDDFEEITSEGEIIEKINYLTKDAVKLQLISDRPVGLYLSGGIDSTILAGLVSQYHSGKLKTFSAAFDIGGKFNSDADLAKKTSRYFGTDHQQLLITGKDMADNLEKVIYHLDEPIANTPQVAEFLLAKFTKEKVAVVLTGGGGDELYAGYPRYYYNQIIDRFQALPRFLQSKLLLSLADRISKKNLSDKFTARGLKRYSQYMFRPEPEIADFLNSKINHPEITYDFYEKKFFSHLPRTDFTKYFILVDILTWLTDFGLINSDKMSMAAGLEQRVPFLDHRLVELSIKIPTKYKIKRGKGKYIFKKAMADYLPKHVLDEPKRGFFAPASEWLRRDLNPLAREALSPDYNPETQEYFNFQQIKRIFDEHINRKSYRLNTLWSLLTFQIWYKLFIKGRNS
jgi:asparagine synthase (glutamine-hydrolysing)